MVKVSIIIAVYNVEKYLKQCLDSLINQTLTDIEIICTDDGSTDNSLNILKEYQIKDSRIKIIEQKNQGPGVARNNAIDIATGKYIMIVDPDDWLELNACKLAYNQIEKNDNDFVIFDYKLYMEKSGNIVEEDFHLLAYKDVTDNPRINVKDLQTNFFQNGFTWGKIFNKEFLEKNNIKYAPLYLCEDIPFSFLSLLMSNNISILNKKLYVYRVRNNSASSKYKNWQDLLESREYVLNFLTENNYSNNILKYYTEYSYNSLTYWYKKFAFNNSSIKKIFKEEMLKYFNKLRKYTNLKNKYRYFLYKYNLDRLYYMYIRPIGKYCIVLPYRKIKNCNKIHN